LENNPECPADGQGRKRSSKVDASPDEEYVRAMLGHCKNNQGDFVRRVQAQGRVIITVSPDPRHANRSRRDT
jgi:hypothetical protein